MGSLEQRYDRPHLPQTSAAPTACVGSHRDLAGCAQDPCACGRRSQCQRLLRHTPPPAAYPSELLATPLLGLRLRAVIPGHCLFLLAAAEMYRLYPSKANMEWPCSRPKSLFSKGMTSGRWELTSCT